MITDWMKKNIVWVMLGGVVVLFLLNMSLIWVNNDPNWRGTFGDQFGAVNALFSGLAFAGLIYTIILQRRDLKLQRNDLKLQREELALTRKEMEEQTAEFEKQNETMKRQRFESLFYNMLNLQQQIVDGLRYDYYDDEKIPASIRGSHSADGKLVKREVVGRDVFRYLFMDVRIKTGRNLIMNVLLGKVDFKSNTAK